MRIALYTGDHAADGWLARLGWWITRFVQKGKYGYITHCEAIHAEHSDGSVTIASASLLDGGVRSKRARLNPLHWIIVDVRQWDMQASMDLLVMTNGAAYDWRGALATVILGSPKSGRWFCNQWVGSPFLKAPASFGPHQFAAICLTLGVDVTKEFFGARL